MTTPETDTDPLGDDEIVATYLGYRMASFWIPPRRYNTPKGLVDYFCRAIVCLDHYDFVGHGRIPSSENELISVCFLHGKWTVWVSVPYTYAKSRLP
ncbi:hypothetical protein BDW59DRAFT_155394 [Aspergillus cavernicola]|uniref:Uncharacterized protein n=1 Tax=Aspergillus cavernicola TaxID=176166 RepID=A0ABR4H983_9EURO